jgi:hypothetical protein
MCQNFLNFISQHNGGFQIPENVFAVVISFQFLGPLPAALASLHLLLSTSPLGKGAK